MTLPLVRTLEANTVGVAAASNQLTIMGMIPAAGVVASVTYIPSASVTGLTAATAARTFTVYNRGSSAVSGTGTVAVATLTIASGTNLVDNVPIAFTLGTASKLVVASGDVLELESLAITTGVLDPGGKIIATFSRT